MHWLAIFKSDLSDYVRIYVRPRVSTLRVLHAGEELRAKITGFMGMALQISFEHKGQSHWQVLPITSALDPSQARTALVQRMRHPLKLYDENGKRILI